MLSRLVDFTIKPPNSSLVHLPAREHALREVESRPDRSSGWVDTAKSWNAVYVHTCIPRQPYATSVFLRRCHPSALCCRRYFPTLSHNDICVTREGYRQQKNCTTDSKSTPSTHHQASKAHPPYCFKPTTLRKHRDKKINLRGRKPKQLSRKSCPPALVIPVV